jgi:hypothetical protein
LKGQESVVELVRKEGRRRRGEDKKEERLGGLVFIGGQARKAARQKEINPGKGHKGQRQPPKKS